MITQKAPATAVDPAIARSLAHAVPRSFWLDQPDAPEPLPALAGSVTADLAVIGGGFTGLWTALLARERFPDLDVVLLEAKTVAWAASGRNGGFCSASLTHGIGNGLERFGDEMPLLEKLGEQNLREIGETIAARGIDCDFSPTGEVAFGTADWQVEGLDEEAVAARQLGHDVEVLDGPAARRELNSPLWKGGLKFTTGNALVEPGRLAWGLRRACLDAGVRIFEHTPVTSLTPESSGGPSGDRAMMLRTPYGGVRAGMVALAAGVPGGKLLRRIGAYVIPVWDYVLMTEPLSAEQLDSLGWRDRRGAADLGNQFHYFRLTRDNRVLWGGYDAVYYNGGRVRSEHETRPETFVVLAAQFFDTFPQLAGVSFSHAWGGVIDTCSRFCAFFGTAHGGRVAYVAGYTGLGVGATRFGAQVLLDKLHNLDTERVRLTLARSKPVPFPPEPLRSGVIQATRSSIARADRNEGKRDAWLRLLDRLGLGFDS
ncbi:FAD-dependent oxidoreductase [Trebonia kvetii]|uniref:FAD-dependent oxidoreductase n=1 Tax=Trebonia kvetii TaxID=2480626 RepID=A0A6P2BZ02_9ACTN|nr:FAD-dependent oxidoreductase [Trebonia kvetii]TVZ03436.1 FAD-dependent oxidoreductase [Trebonia kvetii]